MVNRRALLFGILALAFGLTGAYLNYEWLSSRTHVPVTEAVEQSAATVQVVVAKAGLVPGEAIRDLQLTTIPWPADLLPPGAVLAVGDAEGRVPRRTVSEGEPLMESALFPQGAEGGLSPIISEGHRAVAVKVNEVIGIAGFIKPGATVDVLATIRERGRAGASTSFSKVILQDVKVLAVDQTMEEGNRGDPALVSVVTLEVVPRDAQKLTFAAHEGDIQLALRNPADNQFVRTNSVNANSLRGYRPAPKAKPVTKVEVIKGLDVSSRKF